MINISELVIEKAKELIALSVQINNSTLPEDSVEFENLIMAQSKLTYDFMNLVYFEYGLHEKKATFASTRVEGTKIYHTNSFRNQGHTLEDIVTDITTNEMYLPLSSIRNENGAAMYWGTESMFQGRSGGCTTLEATISPTAILREVTRMENQDHSLQRYNGLIADEDLEVLRTLRCVFLDTSWVCDIALGYDGVKVIDTTKEIYSIYDRSIIELSPTPIVMFEPDDPLKD